jgi:hypothetical protein
MTKMAMVYISIPDGAEALQEFCNYYEGLEDRYGKSNVDYEIHDLEKS